MNLKEKILTKEQKKVLFISILGTALEFYDFTLYSVFAISIGKTFFPADREIVSILSAFGAFAAGFIMRPFGGILLGYLGDTVGRRFALMISILLMGIPAFITGILPSYASIGILAPLIIILSRLIQGLSAGGEFNGAAIFVLEHFKGSKKEGFLSALISSAGGAGALLALILGSIANHTSMPDGAWRVPFILGAGISILGFFLRQKIDESPEFKLKPQKTKAKGVFKTILKKYPLSFALVLSIGALDGSLAYLLVGFMNVYLNHFVGFQVSSSMLLSSFGLIFYLIMTPLIGSIYDKMSPYYFFKLAFFFLIITSIPVFYLLQSQTLFLTFLGIFLLATMFASISGSQHAFMQNLFPTDQRYRGIAFGFNLGSCILGGTAPMLLTWLIDKFHNLSIPGYYLCIESILCGMIFHFYFKRDLKKEF